MRSRLALPVLLVGLVVATGPVFAAEAEPAVARQEIKLIQRTDRTEVRLVQQAEQLVPRNRISVNLTVETRGPNAKQVQSEINRRMSDAIAKAQVVESLIIETGSYSVSRPYDSENSKEVDRWRGQQTLSLTSDKFDDVLNMAGQLQSDGLVMSDMRFSVGAETLKAVQDELTTSAIQILKERATKVSADLGLKVERYKTISVGNVSEQYGEAALKSHKATVSSAAKKSPPAVAAGEALVTVTVEAIVVMVQ